MVEIEYGFKRILKGVFYGTARQRVVVTQDTLSHLQGECHASPNQY